MLKVASLLALLCVAQQVTTINSAAVPHARAHHASKATGFEGKQEVNIEKIMKDAVPVDAKNVADKSSFPDGRRLAYVTGFPFPFY